VEVESNSSAVTYSFGAWLMRATPMLKPTERRLHPSRPLLPPPSPPDHLPWSRSQFAPPSASERFGDRPQQMRAPPGFRNTRHIRRRGTAPLHPGLRASARRQTAQTVLSARLIQFPLGLQKLQLASARPQFVPHRKNSLSANANRYAGACGLRGSQGTPTQRLNIPDGRVFGTAAWRVVFILFLQGPSKGYRQAPTSRPQHASGPVMSKREH